MDENLYSILNSDSRRNISALGFLSNYPVEEYNIEKKSIIFLSKSDVLWTYIAGSCEKDISVLLEKYSHKYKNFASVEDWMIPLILKHGEADWIMETNRYIFDLDKTAELPKTNVIEIDKSYANTIYDNSDYKKYISAEYIEERLRKDISAGIIIDKSLVAWGFTHDDGALGFLHVLPAYRMEGYGQDITLGLIQMRKETQKPVYVNIVPENQASINLVTKLGFKFDQKVFWLKLK